MSTRKEQFAAAAVTGLTSGAGQGVVNVATIAKTAFEIADALERIFASADGAPQGAPVVVQLQQAPLAQPSIAPYQQYGQQQQQPQMAPVMGSPMNGGQPLPNMAGFPPMPNLPAGAPAAAPGPVAVTQTAGQQTAPGVDWEDPSDPNALSNREARHWRRLIPSLPPRPNSYDESAAANNARKMRLMLIMNYKSVVKDWPIAYMKPPAEGGVGEPPPEGLNPQP
jgi:hypothetical protein